MKRELKKLEEAGQVLLQEINEPEGEPTGHKRSFWNVISIPALAILTGLIIGAILIVATSSSVYEAFSHSFGEGLAAIGKEVFTAYKALFTGSIGDPVRIINAISSGDDRLIRAAVNPFLESLVQATPYILLDWLLHLAFGLACSTSELKGSCSSVLPVQPSSAMPSKACPLSFTCLLPFWQAH